MNLPRNCEGEGRSLSSNTWPAAPGGGGGGWETGPPQTFQRFITLMPMGGAWKESTSNDPRPPNRRAVTPPLLKANHRHTTHTRTVKIGNL